MTKLENLKPGLYWAKYNEEKTWCNIVKIEGTFPFLSMRLIEVDDWAIDETPLEWADVTKFTFGPLLNRPLDYDY